MAPAATATSNAAAAATTNINGRHASTSSTSDTASSSVSEKHGAPLPLKMNSARRNSAGSSSVGIQQNGVASVGKVNIEEVSNLSAFLGVCDPNRPAEFMHFIDRTQEYLRLSGPGNSASTLRLAVLDCVRSEAYHWYMSERKHFDDGFVFLKALQSKFKNTVLAHAVHDIAMLEPRSLDGPDVRRFLEQFYGLADVIENFQPDTNVYGLLYKKLYKHDEIKKHLMGPGRDADLLTNCLDIKAITLREEYADSADMIQRAMANGRGFSHQSSVSNVSNLSNSN